MNFEEAKTLVLRQSWPNPNLQNHSLAVAAVMRHLARRLGRGRRRSGPLGRHHC